MEIDEASGLNDEDEGCVEVDVKEIVAGQSYPLNGMDVSGLREDTSSTQFYARSIIPNLFANLEKSTLLQGPPGSGKSTAVWFWLQRFVLRTKECGVWFHFHKQHNSLTCVVVASNENGNTVHLTEILEENAIDYVAQNYNVKCCVVDGVRVSNQERAAATWRVFGKIPFRLFRTKHMIWVSSQQVVIPGEELINSNTTELSFISWRPDELRAFAHTFSETKKAAFIEDAKLIFPSLDSFDAAIDAKFWLFGGSARWMFGMPAKLAREDIDRYIEKIDDAEKLNAGLQGVRGDLAVNHVVGRYADRSIELISSYVLECIAKRVGLKAICVMYNSPWVRNNPSVHGFVFEWDIFAQVQAKQKLELVTPEGHELTWSVDEDVTLEKFLADGVTSARTMVRPPKWNHPEFDGLLIERDDIAGINHLIAWNASEAATHKATVHNLVALLWELATRDEQPISFSSVRFIFIVPKNDLANFRLPSDQKTLEAKQAFSVAPWGFTQFEVLGATPSSLG